MQGLIFKNTEVMRLKQMLYICSTPIGNLGDITPRAIEILKTADIVACETVGQTRKLLSALGISAKLVSYREGNRDSSGRKLIENLKNGMNIALVSDAGVPCISDPGYRLVNEAYENSIQVATIPGPSSVMAALSISGFSADSFLFLGFLPRKNTKRESSWKEIEASSHTSVFFEAPHRIIRTIEELEKHINDRRICIARELTKKFEEIIRGYPSDALKELRGKSAIQGEFVIAIEGRSDSEQEEPDEEDIAEEIKKLESEGIKAGQTAKIIAEKFGIGKNKAYEIILSLREKDI